MLVNLVFDYYTDVINVPDEIGTQIKKYQKLFPKKEKYEVIIQEKPKL